MLKVHYSTMLEAGASESLNNTLRIFQEKGYEIKDIKYRTDLKPSERAFPDVYITSMILYDDREVVKPKAAKNRQAPSQSPQGVS